MLSAREASNGYRSCIDDYPVIFSRYYRKIGARARFGAGGSPKGLSAAVPGILAGLANTASGCDGVQKLSRAIAQVESIVGRNGDILNNLLGSSKSVMESGWNIGSSVPGGSSLETLSSAVAKFAGFDAGGSLKRGKLLSK